MKNEPSVLITGSSGVLGTALKKLLTDSGVTFSAPSSKELNLLDAEGTIQYLSTHKPKTVIHLAALVYGLGGNLKNQMQSLLRNTAINNNLFAALYEHPPTKIFFAGTVASYPFPYKTLPLVEKDFFDGLPHYGEFGYAMAKRHAYAYLRILKEAKDTSFIYGTFTNLFGKHDNFDIENGHVIPSLIAKAHQARIDHIPLGVWGSGDAERDFLYGEEAAAAILFLLNIEPINDIINISSGKACSIRYLAKLVGEAIGVKDISFLQDMPSGIMQRVVCNKKLSQLGFKYTKRFEDAIIETCDWYVSQQGTKKTISVDELRGD